MILLQRISRMTLHHPADVAAVTVSHRHCGIFGNSTVPNLNLDPNRSSLREVMNQARGPDRTRMPHLTETRPQTAHVRSSGRP
jgi:hypothetical protein